MVDVVALQDDPVADQDSGRVVPDVVPLDKPVPSGTYRLAAKVRQADTHDDHVLLT
jgi:hypothetical protein